MSDTTLHAPHPAEIDGIWHAMEPLVAGGINADFTSEDVRDMLVKGSAQMWYTLGTTTGHSWPECCLITRVINYPARRVCQLWVVSGVLPDNWPHVLGLVENWARLHNCVALSLHGRRGWERKLGSGWAIQEVWMERPICSG